MTHEHIRITLRQNKVNSEVYGPARRSASTEGLRRARRQLFLIYTYDANGDRM